ncbi:citramalate synthase [Synechococcus sp. PCC 7336]|uniref:citramalate synthase n=1 Tax=Synechococcus sp. PCC 7336 TaxID=195250 RepID=UPI000346359A|nr:citramalate synthase [Synechococcus sp. PCC 7336]
MANPTIALYDTTLRDGAQQEGLSLSVRDKLVIAKHLDRLGVPFIEGGWPGANPKDVQFFWQLKEEPLERAEVVAFCSTRRPHRPAADEPMFQPILAAGTQYVTLFGKSWDLHVTASLRTTLAENLEMIRDSVAYLRSQHRQTIYDAEHWFDAYRQNPDYALETLKAATDGGAEWLVLCDTNGGTLPHDIHRITAAVARELHQLGQARLGIHTHNDSDTAVANAIAAVQAGAEMVQGTVNGYGERCGNANLCSLIPNLQLKLGYACIPSENLKALTETSRAVSEIANQAPSDRAPFVGLSAFAHKGGIHVSAVQKNPVTYEHVPPEAVGNSRRIVISEQAGLSNVLAKVERFGISLDKSDPVARDILKHLKQLEHEGYQFEGAEASFELLVRTWLGQRPQFFCLIDFHVHSSTQASPAVCQIDLSRSHTEPSATINSVATVKLAVGDREHITAAEGNGPVAALDGALRKVLVEAYPDIDDFQLADYKVRILDGKAGTAARTRVSIEFSHSSGGLPATGERRWTTVGVSGNIIEASYLALAEGLEYGLLKTMAPLSDPSKSNSVGLSTRFPSKP